MIATVSETPLRDALLAIRGASNDLQLRAARSRMVELLSGPVHALAHRKLAGKEQAKEIAQDALLAVLEKAHQCRATEDSSPERAERAAWSWAFIVVRRKIIDLFSAHAQEKRIAEELSRTIVEEQAPEDPQDSLEELLALSEQGALALIEAREPEDLYRDARAEEVAASTDRVRRDIDSFRQVKLLGRRCLEVGLERGCEGPEGRIQNLVSKQVERGKKALYYGALAAARASETEREWLERFARGLLQVGKLS